MGDTNSRDATLRNYRHDIRLAEEALAHALDERELACGRWHVAHSDCCEYGFSANTQRWLEEAEKECAEKDRLYTEAKLRRDALVEEYHSFLYTHDGE